MSENKTQEKETKPTSQLTPEELSFQEMARMIQEKEASGLEMQVFIRNLEAEVSRAARRVEVAKMLANVVQATKARKTRSDKGKSRKTKPEGDQSDGKEDESDL